MGLALYKPDHVIAKESLWDNAGGEPPGAQIGCFDGLQAVYGLVWDYGVVSTNPSLTKAVRPGKLMFSLPGQPTMVPQEYQYDIGLQDSYTFPPRPWRGEFVGGVLGRMTAMATGGGLTAVFCTNSTSQLLRSGDGRVRPRVIHPSKGVQGDGAACGTVRGVHGVGPRTWLRLSAGSVAQDIAEKRFAATLEDIPIAQGAKIVTAYYGYRDQVWAAVPKAGATVAQRILVWDEGTASLVIFEPACLDTDEGITAMVEYAVAGAEPVMLVGTSAGRILKYPDGTTDAGTGYAAQWRGYWGSENIHRHQTVEMLEVHTGGYCASNVTWTYKPLRTASGDGTARTGVFQAHDNNRMVSLKTTLDKIEGRVFQLQFSSEATSTDPWEIRQVVWKFKRNA